MNNLFKTKISVLVNHLNYGNHLGHDSMLSILQETRLRWLKSIGANYSEVKIDKEIGWLIKEIWISFESESHYGDELSIELFLKEYKKTTFTLGYTVKNIATKNIICRGTTKQVCFDFNKKKISRIPSMLMSLFESFR